MDTIFALDYHCCIYYSLAYPADVNASDVT